jgi:hypothetical protein
VEARRDSRLGGVADRPAAPRVVGGRMNAFGCGAGVAGVAGWLFVDPCAAVARARCASRPATSALLVTIAEAEVPPAAQRLRNDRP